MTDARIVRSRLKLLALFAVFALPMAMAWGMSSGGSGFPMNVPLMASCIPISAVGRLAVEPGGEGRRRRLADGLRLHERLCRIGGSLVAGTPSLGRDAHRVSRLRIGEGGGKTLPGEAIATWHDMPTWREPGTLWILDPDGRPVLSYGEGVAASNVLEDIERLLKLNPERPLARLHDE